MPKKQRETKDIVKKAEKFARKAHAKQLDDEGKPYIIHPEQTYMILSMVTRDEVLLASAWLHDVIEDTAVSYKDLEAGFGKEIADLVNEVTHEGKKDSRGYYFPRLYSQRGIILKFADRLSNISRMGAWDEKRKKQYLQKSKFWKSEL